MENFLRQERVVRGAIPVDDRGRGFAVKILSEGGVLYEPLDEYRSRVANSVLEICIWLLDNTARPQKIVKLLLENGQIVERMLSCASTDEALHVLRGHQSFTQEMFMMPESRDFVARLPVPTIDACLMLKDTLSISDHGWKLVQEAMNLPPQ